MTSGRSKEAMILAALTQAGQVSMSMSKSHSRRRTQIIAGLKIAGAGPTNCAAQQAATRPSRK